MNMPAKLPREQCEFVLEEGIGAFLFLMPGQAQDSHKPGSKAYKLEWSGDLFQNSAVVRAVTVVAQYHDPANWQQQVFGPNGTLKRLEEMPKRDKTKYPYAAGKFVLTLSQVYSPESLLKSKDINLALPADRARWDEALAAVAPGARRFANPADPSDVARIQQMNQVNLMKGLAPILEADYYKTLLPVAPHEIWAGCYVRPCGRAYWSTARKAVNLALEHVLMTRQGERIVGESSPDAAFAAFAPSASLAPLPIAPAMSADPWKSLIGG